MTKGIKRIRDLFEYALYKFTLYLLTYLLTSDCYIGLLSVRRKRTMSARC